MRVRSATNSCGPVSASCAAHAQRLRDRQQHEGRILDRGERHEEHAVREVAGKIFGSLHR